MSEAPWDRYLTDADRAVIARARFARRMGFGERPALLLVDCQRYMVGERGREDGRYPSSCGAAGWTAIDAAAGLAAAARAAEIPVFMTRFALAADGSDMGVYRRKRDLLDSPNWCLDGTPGAEIVPELGPAPGDIVFTKTRPSSFFGTPLLARLRAAAIDTLIVAGGATSNCIRATVFDSAAHDLRTIVAREAVFDRFPLSHAVALFDMDRQFADVVDCAAIVAFLARRTRA